MQKLLTLGDFYTSDFVKDRADYADRKKFSLDLILDEKIGAAKLTEQPPSDQMWGKYWYRSNTNVTMVKELKNIADEICSRIKYKKGDVWLDIACNTGSMFPAIPNEFVKLGIDPADDTYLVESSKVADKVLQDYFSSAAYAKLGYAQKAKVITTIAMFYDLEDPHSFIEEIKKVLDDDGIFVIQMSYAGLMIQQLAFDNICFKPDALVMGINKKIKDIKKDDLVLDYQGDYTKVAKTFKRKYSGNLYNIKGAYLEPLEVTPEHPILVVKKDNFEIKKTEWTPAKDVSIGDHLCVPKIKTKKFNTTIDLTKYNNLDSPHHRRGLESFTLNEDLIWMMGLYVAEGHITGPENNLQINFTLHIKEQEYAQRVIKAFKSIGYNAWIRPAKTSKAMNVQASCTALAKIFREWFGIGAKKKQIPDFLFTSEREIAIPFITGIIDGDGCVNAKRQVGLHSVSKKLINQVQLMLATLNCMAGISYCIPPKTPYIYKGKPIKGGDSWLLRGTNKFLSKIFCETFEHKMDYQFDFDDKYIYVPVKNISKKKYNGYVHNIETENNTYVVNNAVVHNCHEHYYYYSLNSLKKLFEQHGMVIVDADLNDVNGGSIRVYFQKKERNITSFATAPLRAVCDYRINALLDYENSHADITNLDMWKKFGDQIEKLKNETVSFIKAEKAKGKTVFGYGASTKGNTLLQLFGLDETLIDAIAERSPYKYGLKTVGTNIPIISEADARARNPDYFLMLPWPFVKEFVEREKEFLDRGGKFIIPCPEFQIIGKQ